jgi:hypothetical protein
MSPRFLMTLSSALYLTSSVFAGAGSPVPSNVCYRAWKAAAEGPHRVRPGHHAADLNVCFSRAVLESCLTGIVKSFGRRQAYESPRGRNPRATGDGYGYGYGDFGFPPVSSIARPPSGSAGMDADRALCCASARCCWFVARPDARPSFSIIGMDACGSLAGG